MEEIKCKVCGSNKFRTYHKTGELVCECGVVADNINECSQEYRAFGKEGKSNLNRVGAPLTFKIHDKGMHTKIGNHPGDLNKMSAEKR